jgi:hypothetical protein
MVLPAPGMFCTTMVGLPGMCLRSCAAKVRASVSIVPPASTPTMTVSRLPA